MANELQLGVAGAQTQRIFAYPNLVSNGPDRDFYRFTAEAGKTYLIQTFNVELTSGGYGTGRWLYSTSGTLLANDQNGRNGSGNVNAQITFTFTNPGTYFVQVGRADLSRWSGPYSIRACEESCASASSSVYLPLIRR